MSATVLKEKCGVFAVFGTDRVVEKCYFGLHAMQHRGQESAGLLSAMVNGCVVMPAWAW